MRRRRQARSPTPDLGAEYVGMTISGLSMATGKGVPSVDGDGVPSGPAALSTFAFEGGPYGVFDASKGEVLLVAMETVKGLVTVVCAGDDWFEREYGEMVPPPEVRDLRGMEGAAVTAMATGPEGIEAGGAEVVLRMDKDGFTDLIEAIAELCRKDRR